MAQSSCLSHWFFFSYSPSPFSSSASAAFLQGLTSPKGFIQNPKTIIKIKTLSRKMGSLKTLIKKSILNLGEMELHKGGGKINWYPGHMASATRAIRNRLKLSDLVIEVRDARIPLSSMNQDLQPLLAGKRRVIALNKIDLVGSDVMKEWKRYFDSCGQDCLAINAHSRTSVHKLLDLSEYKLREKISTEPTLLIMVVGVPNVGKSALINSISQIASLRLSRQGKTKRATVGPLPGVTQDIAGFKIAQKPSIYVLDTPGVLVPSISDIEIGLKLALAGSVKDSVVGEDRIAQYLLAVLNTRGTPHWKHLLSTGADGVHAEYEDRLDYKLKNLLPMRNPTPDKPEDIATRVKHALCLSLSEFDGSVEDENDLECLIYKQFEVLQKAMKIPHQASEARLMVAKRFLALFRSGKLGHFILDNVPDAK